MIMRVTVRVIVAVMLVVMVVLVRVRMSVIALPCLDDLDVRRGQPGAEHLADAKLVADAEAAEGAPQLVNRQARVDERAEDHVAGRAGETVEVQHRAHSRSLMLCTSEQYLPSAKIK